MHAVRHYIRSDLAIERQSQDSLRKIHTNKSHAGNGRTTLL